MQVGRRGGSYVQFNSLISRWKMLTVSVFIVCTVAEYSEPADYCSLDEKWSIIWLYCSVNEHRGRLSLPTLNCISNFLLLITDWDFSCANIFLKQRCSLWQTHNQEGLISGMFRIMFALPVTLKPAPFAATAPSSTWGSLNCWFNQDSCMFIR